MVLNMAQTWHQLRPGEIRTNCGGCHAQQPATDPLREDRPPPADYASSIDQAGPLLTSKANDQSGKHGTARETGLALKKGRQERRVFPRIKPILDRKAESPAIRSQWDKPAGNWS